MHLYVRILGGEDCSSAGLCRQFDSEQTLRCSGSGRKKSPHPGPLVKSQGLSGRLAKQVEPVTPVPAVPARGRGGGSVGGTEDAGCQRRLLQRSHKPPREHTFCKCSKPLRLLYVILCFLRHWGYHIHFLISKPLRLLLCNVQCSHTYT